MPVLEVKDLSKIYGSKGKGVLVKALDEFNMNINKGEFVELWVPLVVERLPY